MYKKHIILNKKKKKKKLGQLGRFTNTPRSAKAKGILEAGNYNIGEEDKPAYAEGLDNVNIVKVICGGNATFAISDQGHLYMTGTFKVCMIFILFYYVNMLKYWILLLYLLF